MSKHVGVDWAGNGWIAVIAEGDDWHAEFLPSMLSLWRAHDDAATILIDIPIGLPQDERRDCDVAAREFLGERRSSVFYTPVRDAVYADSYEAAAAVNEDARGDGLSAQAWSIVPRIRAVDEFLREYERARETIRESHPEVCFAALSDGRVEDAKDDEDGYEQRVEALAALDTPGLDADLDAEYAAIEERQIDDLDPYERRIGTTNRDDLLDAFALAATAVLGGGGFSRVGADEATDPPTDDRGLPMEIVYAEP